MQPEGLKRAAALLANKCSQDAMVGEVLDKMQTLSASACGLERMPVERVSVLTRRAWYHGKF